MMEYKELHRTVTGKVVEMQPGDGTRYVLLVAMTGMSGLDSVVVTATNLFRRPAVGFGPDHLDQFVEHANDVMHYSYEEYRLGVENHEWLKSTFFPFAKDIGINPWTLLAMMHAACRVTGRVKP